MGTEYRRWPWPPPAFNLHSSLARHLPPSGRYTLCCGRGAGVPVSIPMALMSSSMSGQWTPCPVPIISKCCRCSGVALAKRHDHTSGTLMVRPSARCAVIRSAVTSTERIRGSLLATMLMPGLQDTREVLHNKSTNPVQFARGKAMIHTQGNWDQPKLTYHALAPYMDVRRFVTIKAVEEQAIGTWNIGNRGHAIRLKLGQEKARCVPQYS